MRCIPHLSAPAPFACLSVIGLDARAPPPSRGGSPSSLKIEVPPPRASAHPGRAARGGANIDAGVANGAPRAPAAPTRARGPPLAALCCPCSSAPAAICSVNITRDALPALHRAASRPARGDQVVCCARASLPLHARRAGALSPRVPAQTRARAASRAPRPRRRRARPQTPASGGRATSSCAAAARGSSRAPAARARGRRRRA